MINTGLALVLLGVSLLTIDNVSAYVDSFNEENQNKAVIKETIEKDYEGFIISLKYYKEEIPNIYGFYSEYYEDLAEKEMIYSTIMKGIEEKLENTISKTSNLKLYCAHNFYESNILKKCQLYSENYGLMVESFIKLIVDYNERVEKYNNWANEHNKKALEKYTSLIYNNYIV